jgi:hypothetical protein
VPLNADANAVISASPFLKGGPDVFAMTLAV